MALVSVCAGDASLIARLFLLCLQHNIPPPMTTIATTAPTIARIIGRELLFEPPEIKQNFKKTLVSKSYHKIAIAVRPTTL